MIQLEKKLISQDDNLASIFYNARKEKGVSLAEVAQTLLIHPKYLRMLETGDYDNFPGRPYDYQFIKKYSEYLGLNFKETWNLYKVEQNIYAQLVEKKKKKDILDQKVSLWDKFINFLNLPKLLFNGILLSVVFLVFFYFSWSVYGSSQAPNLEIYSPENNLITKSLNLEIVGKTDVDASLSINGKYVLVNDKEGTFKEKVELHPGINVIKIIAKKKHHKETVLYRQIMVLNDDDLSKK